MAERRPPASLVWLAALVALSVVAALAGGLTLYLETRAATRTTAEAITHGHVDAGRQAFALYGCGACHEIPGVSGATGAVGPALAGIATRAHIAGALSNDPETMVRWLMHPQQLRPGSGMPELGVSERDARDMASYLYTAK